MCYGIIYVCMMFKNHQWQYNIHEGWLQYRILFIEIFLWNTILKMEHHFSWHLYILEWRLLYYTTFFCTMFMQEHVNIMECIERPVTCEKCHNINGFNICDIIFGINIYPLNGGEQSFKLYNFIQSADIENYMVYMEWIFHPSDSSMTS